MGHKMGHRLGAQDGAQVWGTSLGHRMGHRMGNMTGHRMGHARCSIEVSGCLYLFIRGWGCATTFVRWVARMDEGIENASFGVDVS